MTSLVPVHKDGSTQISLTDLQDKLDARAELAAEGTGAVSTRKSRVAKAKQDFQADPVRTVLNIEVMASDFVDAYDDTITVDSVPLAQDQINQISNEWMRLDRLKTEIEALETRYRELIFAHLDETGPKIPGRPASHTPGQVAAEGPGPHIIFARRGGNRANPELDAEGLKAVLPDEIAAQLFVTVHHDPVPAWDEKVFNEERLNELVASGQIDLDTLAPFLKPGARRTPTFNKTLVDG